MARRLLVGTGITENYYPRTLHFGYFETLNGIVGDRVQTFSVLLDHSDTAATRMHETYPSISFVRMCSKDVRAPNPNGCLQHGAFVEGLVSTAGLRDEDYVIFTDSDMTVQRPFTDDEIDRLLVGEVFSAMNWHPQETLAEELPALQPTVPAHAVSQAFPGIERLLCFNTGVLGATIRDWRRLLSLYVRRYPLVASYMQHYARQQWLLCWLLQTQGFRMIDPNSDFVRTVHTHGHEPRRAARLLSTGVDASDPANVRYRGTPVIFAHNLR